MKLDNSSHDCIEDYNGDWGQLREGAYRRGCQQSLFMAIDELRRRKVPIASWPWMLNCLLDVLCDLRFERKTKSGKFKQHPCYMHEAILKAWGPAE